MGIGNTIREQNAQVVGVDMGAGISETQCRCNIHILDAHSCGENTCNRCTAFIAKREALGCKSGNRMGVEFESTLFIH